MIDHIIRDKPHFIRLVQIGGDKTAPKLPETPPPQSGLASVRVLMYDADRIFETLPEALSDIHRRDPNGTVLIEADADPILRCAYPYDHRVFVMSMPSGIHSVFRNPREAAGELRKVLDDTAAFAGEIFGLFQNGQLDDPEPREDRMDLTGTVLRGFLYSPLGDELATRIQLQPLYHGLVESDIIAVNTNAGRKTDESQECLRRIDRLLNRVHAAGHGRTEVYHCPLLSPTSPQSQPLLRALQTLCAQ